MFGLPIVLVLICTAIVLAVLGVGGFLVLLKLGVIVREAGRPTYEDRGSYSLDLGREVRPEEEQRQRETSDR